MKATVKLILDTKTKDSAKKVFMQVTWKRKAYQYSLSIDEKLTKDEFANKRLAKTKKVLELAKPKYDKAIDIVNELSDSFTFEKFKKLWKGEHPDNSITADLVDVYKGYIEDNRISEGTKRSYLTAVKSINTYHQLKVTEWNKEYMEGFISHLEQKGLSQQTIGIYVRSLRALHNYAKNWFSLSNTIFKGWTPKQSMHKNKVLTNDELKKFLNYTPSNKVEEFAKDMFLITFGMSGANIADILLLRNKQVEGNKVQYIREKTKNRTKTKEPISVEIDSETIERINKYGVINPSTPNDFVFPFISNGMTEKQILMKRKDVNKVINSGLKSIAENIGISHFTLYSARHTVSTLLMNSGTPVAHISKSLGHTSIATTEHYLAGLSDENQHAIALRIGDFLHQK